MTEYATVEGVEIISAGMAWNGLTGAYFVTAEHLADMVAAQADPLIRRPRVKLGHLDRLFNGILTSHDPANMDAEPAFGSVVNMRLNDAGVKIIGDLAEVPAWLVDAMPSAYPTRSAEWVWEHETAGGRKYMAVLTDVALGGVWEPAVADLADITREQAVAALQTLLEQGPAAAQAQLARYVEPTAAAAYAVAAAL